MAAPPPGNLDKYYYYIKVVSDSGEVLKDFNLELDDVKTIAKNFNNGDRISVGDGLISRQNIKSIRIVHWAVSTEKDSVFQFGRNLTNSFVSFGPSEGKAPQPAPEIDPQKEIVYDPKKVFIVHGHDNTSKIELSNFLFRRGLHPITLREEEDEGVTTIIQKFTEYAEKVGYAFVLLTPDDVGGLKSDIASDTGNFPTTPPKLNPRARQNVILELGYFMGKLGLDRVCVMTKRNEKKEEEVEPPSDMGGVAFLKFTNSVTEKDFEIVKKLNKAGYKLDL